LKTCLPFCFAVCSVFVFAQGVPDGGLMYSGTIIGSVGATPSVGLSLWDDPNSLSVANRVCETVPRPVELRDSRFTLSLDPSCADAFRRNSELWVQLSVAGTSLQRVRLGHVPYAVRAVRSERTVIDSRVPGFVSPRISTHGLACGGFQATGSLLSQGSNGYIAGRLLCQQACGGSETAHICSVTEAITSYSVGVPAYGRLSGGVASSGTVGGVTLNDCGGFVLSNAASASAFWYIGTTGPSWVGCAATELYACCD
jgi:hypothetical protein